jgi:hypothetical protein
MLSSYFRFSHDFGPLIREILLFADHPPENLCVSKEWSAAIDHPAYWRQLLQRDFGLPCDYSNSLVNTGQDPTATLRAVYQRLTHLKACQPVVYQAYKTLILDCGINFLPLSAIGPFYPAIPAEQRRFNLCEAIRLKNTGLAAKLLLQIFPDITTLSNQHQISEFANTFVNDVTLNIAIELATKGSKKSTKAEIAAVDQKELLRFLSPFYLRSEHPSTCNMIQHILRDEKIWPTGPTTAHDLNTVILYGQFYLATKLLQKGVIPNQNTLKITLSSAGFTTTHLNTYNDLVFGLIKLIPNYPHLLNMDLIGDKDMEVSYFHKLSEHLFNTADVKLANTIYNLAKHFPHVFDDNRLEQLLTCLMRIAVMNGDISTIQAHEKQIGSKTTEYMLCFAIVRGQLAVVRHLIKQFDKNTLLCTETITQVIKSCSHTHIVKYFIEEFKLFQMDGAVVEIKPESHSSMMKSLLNSWHQACNAAKRILFKRAIAHLSDLKESWLEWAVAKGNINVIDYLTKQAPDDCQLKPTNAALSWAFRDNQEAAVRYLIEDYGFKPNYAFIDELTRARPMVYFISQCLDQLSPALTPEKEIWKAISRMAKPTDAANKVVDWLLSPEGTKRGYRLGYHLDKLKMCLHHQMSAPMVAWLMAKLGIESDNFYLEHIQRFDHSFNIQHFLPRMEDTSCAAAWQNLYKNAIGFYYRQYCEELSAAKASSSAVILSVIRKENVVEQEQKSTVVTPITAQISLSLTASMSPSEPETDRPGLRARPR